MLYFTIILVSVQNIYSFNTPCRNQDDAANCNNIYKCCSSSKICGTSDYQCDPANGGIPMLGSCYYIQKDCESCCIKTTSQHYCGTKQECDQIQQTRAIWLGIVISYIILAVIFTIVGIFKYFRTKNKIQEIYVQSQRFNQVAQNIQENLSANAPLDQSSFVEYIK